MFIPKKKGDANLPLECHNRRSHVLRDGRKQALASKYFLTAAFSNQYLVNTKSRKRKKKCIIMNIVI